MPRHQRIVKLLLSEKGVHKIDTKCETANIALFFFAFINLPFYQDLSNEDGLNGKSEFCGNINSASENPFNGIPIQIALISPNILDNANIR